MVPAGSSRTECARRHSASRHFGTEQHVFSTLRDRLRNTMSMGNFIPTVCTPSVGTIHSPSPGRRQSCFSRPVRRAVLVLATPARSASTAPLEVLSTRTAVIHAYIGSSSVKLAPLWKSNQTGGMVMPSKTTLKRAQEDKREGKAPSTQAGEFVREE